MKYFRNAKAADLLQVGAGLVGGFLGPVVAALGSVGRVRVIDRDRYTRGQARRSDVGKPKAVVVARLMQAVRHQLQCVPIVADIEHLPLALFRCDILLTALDSKLARMTMNFAFRKLGIPYWIDSGISSPGLVRISTFAQGEDSPCYECGMDAADYASEQSYACQSEFTPPPTNSPAYLGAVAASLQAAECARLLSGQFDQASLNRELLYDVRTHRLFVTRLEPSKTCRLDHSAFVIRSLRRSAGEITVAEVFGLQGGGTTAKASPAAVLEVPGKLFVRELSCQCGERRSTLRLKGRFSAAAQTCAKCGGRMTALGTGLKNALSFSSLSQRELAKPLSALGLQTSDVIAVDDASQLNLFELGHS